MSDHKANCKCSLCGRTKYETFSFKKGYVCEHCLQFVKDVYHPDDPR